jgi:GrpB-like predicted nucleotidyltransferase (UPF0157 family)
MTHDTVEVLPHNPLFTQLFEQEVAKLRTVFGELFSSAYHIGSTPIPDLWAQPILDILFVSTRFLPIDTKNDAMIALGYIPHGEHEIPMRRFFTKREGSFQCNIHAYSLGHAEIKRALVLLDYLKNNQECAAAYSAFKQKLAAQFSDDPLSYEKEKVAYMRTLEHAAGFQEKNIHFVRTDEQWAAFHAMRKKHLFDPYGAPYSTDDLKLGHKAHEYFILYDGTLTIGSAHLIRVSEEATLVHSFIIDRYPDNKEDFAYALPFFRLLEKWAFCQGSPMINIISTPENKDFIIYAGFTEM